ncbi:hypothetical protein SEA_SPEEDDEMON_1000 [Gordonia phage SpeedDemon]|uniref:Uncharacterized protein n=1 Tax=Gordonia phage Bantam TaxID=1887641 RepID=A0A1B3AYG0_9CAUD|nr:hypothetical protein BIZ77_gp081 [Gordonia phage Bantam]AOE43787.1 hypothetical protein SEA_BANTAM_98 [Gordonia phage Bantam]QNL30550.1 hypothetical protein SEA_SPEEDDEMON_1000 [Gordonia phage SpeedDemon]
MAEEGCPAQLGRTVKGERFLLDCAIKPDEHAGRSHELANGIRWQDNTTLVAEHQLAGLPRPDANRRNKGA